MAHGYHSVLHQLESINTCPAHHRSLETACRRCGYEAPYLLNVRLLEAALPLRVLPCELWRSRLDAQHSATDENGVSQGVHAAVFRALFRLNAIMIVTLRFQN